MPESIDLGLVHIQIRQLILLVHLFAHWLRYVTFVVHTDDGAVYLQNLFVRILNTRVHRRIPSGAFRNGEG